MIAARRARLLRLLAPWTAIDGGYEVRVGCTRLSAEVLSDDALEDLAARVVADFWADRRRARLNRPLYVAEAIRAGHALPPETMRFAAGMLGAAIPIPAAPAVGASTEDTTMPLPDILIWAAVAALTAAATRFPHPTVFWSFGARRPFVLARVRPGGPARFRSAAD